ncbi:penicillin acylase family protein [Maribacter sp. 2210JD10-5]|uniref:penicillin acylase family protein n=1 Tax=Maribacter sp. 2210JD10-5 TaxID=3386272 RepID=UPI0039BD488D
MKVLKKVGLGLLIVLVIGVGISIVLVNSMIPDYEGEKELENLKSGVEVYFDTYGIPHIYGANEEDAFRALGYVHAQDRLWQMELLRRIASGGLSEVFGKDLIGTDKFMLSIGIDDASTKTVSQLDKNSKAVLLCEAYLDGINQFVANGATPIEFYLTGIEKTKFTLKDIYNTMGYMAFSFAMAHKTDPLLTNIKDKLGPAYLEDLEIDSNQNTEWIKTYNPKKQDTIGNSIAALVNNALGKLDLPLFEGSNSWVIAPEKTKNGKVIFANDPHIGFSQPSVWYEAHVETPTYSRYGYHIAGIPFPILGHSRKLAYGMTMFENDDVDFYYEETNPSNENEYKVDGGWNTYETITKEIKVKDSTTISFSYKKSNHGPILNGIADQVTGERPIAMSWIYTQLDNKVIDGLYAMSTANNLNEFKNALPAIHAPGLNIMYGDAEGNVAWFASAKLYEIPDSVNTKMVFERGKGLPLNKRFLDFSENPQAINPPWNYVYSANNQPDSVSGNLIPGYYLPENRGKRIVELLESKNDWDKKSASDMILDATSGVNSEIVRNLIKNVNVSELTEEEVKYLTLIESWKGDYPLESIPATIYSRWIHMLLEEVFKDELGDEMYMQFLKTHLSKRTVAPLMLDATSIWWDNVHTPEKKETQKELVQNAFSKAIKSLKMDLGPNESEWVWSNVHTVEHPHPIGQVKALRSFFNVGPFSVTGSREVINNMYFDYDNEGLYETTTGPSTRRIIDFSDIENSISILPTGQSGNLFSKHYKDQAQMYVDGEFRKMMLNKGEITNKESKLLIFKK